MAQVFIGMTTYNGERFIGQAIESLLGQSFSDLTLFISDDTSTDRTEEICHAYAAKDSRVVYRRQEKNIGMFPNFKFVLDAADGNYFMWASHDDLWEKEFVSTCVKNIETRNVDVATSTVADADSFGRNLRELVEMQKLSGAPSIVSIARYVLQPEILGKCNLMYSLFKTEVIRAAWRIYPQRKEWGSDYHFSLGLISHFRVYVDSQVLFKKRQGGHSNPVKDENDSPEAVKRIVIRNPKNHMFPFGRFKSYLRGHLEAVQDTSYRPLVAALLYIRLPRSFFIYMSERNYKKFLPQFAH